MLTVPLFVLPSAASLLKKTIHDALAHIDVAAAEDVATVNLLRPETTGDLGCALVHSHTNSKHQTDMLFCVCTIIVHARVAPRPAEEQFVSFWLVFFFLEKKWMLHWRCRCLAGVEPAVEGLAEMGISLSSQAAAHAGGLQAAVQARS
jgi:hypothetical protein